MNLTETAQLLAICQQYWNMANGRNPKAMTKAWAMALAETDYQTALAAVIDLSRKNKFPPTVAEILEAAKSKEPDKYFDFRRKPRLKRRECCALPPDRAKVAVITAERRLT